MLIRLKKTKKKTQLKCDPILVEESRFKILKYWPVLVPSVAQKIFDFMSTTSTNYFTLPSLCSH